MKKINKNQKYIWHEEEGLIPVVDMGNIDHVHRYKVNVGDNKFLYFEQLTFEDGAIANGWMCEHSIENFIEEEHCTRDDFKEIPMEVLLEHANVFKH